MNFQQEVGYIAASIKSLSDIRVGDTITTNENPANEPLPGYKKVNQWYIADFIQWTEAITKI